MGSYLDGETLTRRCSRMWTPPELLCMRKNKIGLNMQAVFDCRGRILEMSINYGGASANIIAFEASDLYDKLENSLLHNSGLTLFGKMHV
jgi:hypothetical protein